MSKYVITNTVTKETQKVYAEDSKEAKRSVCSCNGWDTADCTVRYVD